MTQHQIDPLPEPRFDRFTRAVAAPSGRRAILKALAGGSLAAALAALGGDAADARTCTPLGRRCRRREDTCCGEGRCKNRRCRCRRGETPCGRGQCCGRESVCRKDRCVPAPPATPECETGWKICDDGSCIPPDECCDDCEADCVDRGFRGGRCAFGSCGCLIG